MPIWIVVANAKRVVLFEAAPLLCVFLGWGIEIGLLIWYDSTETAKEKAENKHRRVLDAWHEDFLKIGKDVSDEEIEYLLNKSPVIPAEPDGKLKIIKVYDWLCLQRSREVEWLRYSDRDIFNRKLGVDLESLPTVPMYKSSYINGKETKRGEGANYSETEFAYDYILSKTGIQYLKNGYNASTLTWFINRETDYYKQCVKYIEEHGKDINTEAIEDTQTPERSVQ